IFMSEGPSVNIYNNVFCQVWATGNLSPGYPVLAGMTQIIRIFNNTFQKGAGILVSSSPLSANKSIYVENNLFTEPSGYAANSVFYDDDGGITNTVLLDYNL